MPTLDPAEILLRATSVLNNFRSSAPWTASLANATLDPTVIFVTFLYDTAAAPVPPLPDYAVTTIRQNSGISARFAFNSENGVFLEAEGIQKSGTLLPPYVATRAAQAKWPGPLPTPDIVWRPCRESSTRFAPFWRYLIGGASHYVRADGQIYDQLTTNIRG